ncbi:hypothetical protein JL721_11703 [Aureococcus anophagefferens]|nr:hypothetical protein JL721_11703 [Aureococcus anophagefferens]
MHNDNDATTVTFYPISVECAAHTCLCEHQDAPPSLAPRTARGFESYDAMNWPIVKLWGRLDSHQPCAVYVHGCFPYFYAAPLEDDDAARRLFADEGRRRELCRRVAKSLDAALRGNDSGQDNGTCARVRAVTSALLTPFYGYASEPAHFLRPYESHVNHHMRFFADRGALAAAALQNPTFRHAPPAAAGDGGRRWTAERARPRPQVPSQAARRRGRRRDRRRVTFRPPVASDGRPASTYAVPALRDLFDEEAARLRADGFDEAAVETRSKSTCWLSPALSPSPPKPVTLGAAAPAEQANSTPTEAPPVAECCEDADEDEGERRERERLTQHDRDSDEDEADRNPAAFVDGNGDEGPPGETWYALRSPDGPASRTSPRRSRR